MSYTRKWAVYGAIFGLCFPLMGIPIEAITRHGGMGAMGKALGSPLIWIIMSAPFWLGLFASFAGRRQDQIIALEAAKRAAFQRTASDIFTAAQTLLSTVSSFSSMTSETAASVRETTATMGQLGHTATQAALTAETVIGLAASSQKSSEEGLSAAEGSMGEMHRLADEVRGLSKRIEGLNDRMRDIFEIASVVNYVADRSQRLADSATAEVDRNPAAKGFEGIVQEMRRHADDAKKAANQVKAILGEVHKSMLGAMTAAENGVRRAEQGAQVAAATGATIKRLATALKDSSSAAREIATVAQQQDHGIDQVLKAMNEIYLATQETMASTQQVAGEAKSLNDLAQALKKSIRT
ncbi:MAG TPA: methyl-accepting chemotaxis protein [Anaeromyxobacteraceae bacterium]|nr:methyl-accepting chemotaxis protein [Anaeromyxobacteraceae bacterium]